MQRLLSGNGFFYKGNGSDGVNVAFLPWSYEFDTALGVEWTKRPTSTGWTTASTSGGELVLTRVSAEGNIAAPKTLLGGRYIKSRIKNCGICVRGSNGKSLSIVIANGRCYVQRQDSSGVNDDGYTSTLFATGTSYHFQRVSVSGSTVVFETSPDDVTWTIQGSPAIADIGGTITEAGVHISSNLTGYCDWLREA